MRQLPAAHRSQSAAGVGLQRARLYRRNQGRAVDTRFAFAPIATSTFETVQRLLQETNVKFTLNPRMVRGLDYYCRTTFEWTTTQLGSQSAVAAGGRYDGLVQELGGPPIPGVGFAMGVERLTMLLRMQETAASHGPSMLLRLGWGKGA